MKSKSFDLKQATTEKHSFDKTAGFVGLYKSAGESYKFAEKHKPDETAKKETLKNKIVTAKRERSPYKNKKKIKQDVIDIPQVIIDGSNIINAGFSTSAGRGSPVNDVKITSTPNTTGKNQSGKVKSIMKTKTPTDESLDSARTNVSNGKPKKRNKSVSFMLDDHEEVVVKRTKSDDSVKVNKKSETTTKLNVKDKRKNVRKLKKDNQSEKENKAADVNNQMDVDSQKSKLNKAKKLLGGTPTSHIGGDAENRNQEIKEKKKKLKKVKKNKPDAGSEVTDTETNNNEVISEGKSKKPRKKKQAKPLPVDIAEGEDEPAAKSRKKEAKPDIAEDLENLSIGDNAHTLTNLLDEMTVVDKDKRKKLKSKFNKKKKPKGQSANKDDTETGEDVKEKVKWKKRKWNKDKKGDADEGSLTNTVIVENLPISIMLNYRKLLTEHFLKYGLIKKIGLVIFLYSPCSPFYTIFFFGHSKQKQNFIQLHSTMSY